MENKKYDPDYDAYYNPETGEWLEPKCSDFDCSYCKNRPDKKATRKVIDGK